MLNRKERVRFKLKKYSSRNRLSVFRSNNHLYAQVIDDKNGVTISSSSSLDPKIRENKLNKKELAEIIGKEIAKKTISKGINEVAFDNTQLMESTQQSVHHVGLLMFQEFSYRF